ncbi:hypothetical protein BC832DRAFT_553672 [Gaertneriomyces semiglobifer]|nr:hypothetical protein BC832DRAFT_553672 [Gaertneriomyces semiglobifer]
MPLHKRKPVDILPLPDIPDREAEVWQIRTTGEIFHQYDDYLLRWNFLRKKQFACTKTGRSNLSYEEALRSEYEATKRVNEQFPEIWRKPAMEIIHYNLDKLNDLVDRLYDFFRDNVFVGEFVAIEVGDQTLMGKVLARISAGATVNGKGSTITPPVSSHPSDLGKPLYRVHLIDADWELLSQADTADELPIEYLLPPSQIKRDRQVLSKQNFKKFIREVATKDVWIGAPWTVKPELLERYDIPNVPPPAVQELLDERHRKLTGEYPKGKRKEEERSPKKKKSHKKAPTEGEEPRKRGRPKKSSVSATPPEPKVTPKPPRSKPIKFPIDDIELFKLAPRLKGKAAQGLELGPRPEPSRDFGSCPPDVVLTLIQTWCFLIAYCRPLNLFPFTLDEFQKSLAHGHTHKAVLMSEAFGALITVTCREWSAVMEIPGKEPLPTDDVADMLAGYEQSYEPEMARAMEEYRTIYASYTEEEKAALDQWWKWEPGKWTSGFESRRSYSLTGSKSQIDAGRLKAWELVLAGIIRDRATISALPHKWTILVQLLRLRQGILGMGMALEGQTSDASHALAESEGRHSRDGTPVYSDEQGEEDDKDGSDREEHKQVSSSRKRRRADESEDDADFIMQEKDPAQRLPKSMCKRGRKALDSPPGNTRLTTRAAVKAKEDEALTFARLMHSAEVGFSLLDSAERLEILSFLIHECVSRSSAIRDYTDECVEQNAELRKEKRDITKQRKDLAAIRADLDSKEPQDLIKEELYAAELVAKHEGESAQPQEKADGNVMETDGSDNESGKRSRRRSSRNSTRVRKLREEQLRREEQERKKREEQEKARRNDKVKQKEVRARAEERRKVDEQDKLLARREAEIEYQLRMTSTASRIRPIGRDRFFNRYWWFDACLGAVVEEDSEVAAVKQKARGRPSQQGAQMEWVSGRLFVEEVGGPDMMNDEEEILMAEQGLTDGEWGFYAEPTQLESLFRWFDPRGNRELELKASLEKLMESIGTCMKHREEDITAGPTRFEAILARRPTRTTRATAAEVEDTNEAYSWESFLEYTNRWAK